MVVGGVRSRLGIGAYLVGGQMDAWFRSGVECFGGTRTEKHGVQHSMQGSWGWVATPVI